jgi:hypothetical protein
MPDGTLFNVQAYSYVTYAFASNKFVANSVAQRNALKSWFNSHGPYQGTYMTTGLNGLIAKKGVAKTLYFLADGETNQSTSSLYNAAKAAGQKIHVVGVDLRSSDKGYKNLHEIASLTGGTQKFV